MKKPIPGALSILCAAALLFACNTDNDVKRLQHTFRGRLSDVPRVQDTTVTRPQWRLSVDVEDETILRGDCTWSGRLGDSVTVYQTDLSPSLYTNTSMGGSKKASIFRSEGVILSMDSIAHAAYLTHYRADFDCEY